MFADVHRNAYSKDSTSSLYTKLASTKRLGLNFASILVPILVGPDTIVRVRYPFNFLSIGVVAPVQMGISAGSNSTKISDTLVIN